MSKQQSKPEEVKPALVDVYREALLNNIPLDGLNQKLDRLLSRTTASAKVEASDDQKRQEKIKRGLPALVRAGAFLLPIAFISIGLFLVGNAVVPIGQYYIQTLPTLSRSDLTTPVPRDQVLDVTPIVIAQASADSSGLTNVTDSGFSSGPTIIDTKLDYTNLSNWFGEAGPPELGGSQEEGVEYTIDIPKLDIKNAKVVIGGTDLNNGLIQYPGTADPGQAGAPVIFGHSVLRQFYNPSEKNPRRYVSIFSTIMTLNPGDEIFVTRDGVKYKYLMRDKTEVKPEDVHILTQNYDAKQLKLVTCTPEGTYLRRGVVTAQLVSS